MVRVLITVARGCDDGCGRRSTSRQSTPWRASVTAAVAPAGPAPTTSTDVSYGRIVLISSDNPYSVGHDVF